MGQFYIGANNPSAKFLNLTGVWKRRGILTMVNQEDLSAEELERLLFDTQKGRFVEPDFARIHDDTNTRLYDAWLLHFRTAAGRPHYPKTGLPPNSRTLPIATQPRRVAPRIVPD